MPACQCAMTACLPALTQRLFPRFPCVQYVAYEVSGLLGKKAENGVKEAQLLGQLLERGAGCMHCLGSGSRWPATCTAARGKKLWMHSRALAPRSTLLALPLPVVPRHSLKHSLLLLLLLPPPLSAQHCPRPTSSPRVSAHLSLLPASQIF